MLFLQDNYLRNKRMQRNNTVPYFPIWQVCSINDSNYWSSFHLQTADTSNYLAGCFSIAIFHPSRALPHSFCLSIAQNHECQSQNINSDYRPVDTLKLAEYSACYLCIMGSIKTKMYSQI